LPGPKHQKGIYEKQYAFGIIIFNRDIDVCKIDNGDYIKVKGVDFGTHGAKLRK
jgi:hypothetical protein